MKLDERRQPRESLGLVPALVRDLARSCDRRGVPQRPPAACRPEQVPRLDLPRHVASL